MRKINLLAFFVAISILTLSCVTNKSLQGNPEERLGWKLGAQAYTFRLFSFAQALDKLDSCDLRYVEAFPGQTIGAGSTEKMGYELSIEGRTLVRRLLKDKGITLHAFGVVGAKDAEEWEKVFLFAKDMGVKVLNVEPSDAHLDIVSSLCDKYKIKAALHNHPDPSKYWKPEVVLDALKGRSKYMGAAADVGHWMRSGLDPVACLKQLEGHIFHLHFKDLNEFGNKKAHDVHWGTGKLPLQGVIDELKRQKFEGMISAEYEYNWANSKDDVRQSVINFRKLIK
ncbi:MULTISPECIES: sugar phosphate isomerase/epimerase family protein [Sphingobacterium]|uniref:sugar phosphate isomerase/epimerase family protein n=1 Tax=Sphingobacterium TaxID=28453 RepID=UPI0013DA2AEA|nr:MULTISPECIES: sugar phosphate isomerase/epimerase [unclassified Sphingobacterium]